TGLDGRFVVSDVVDLPDNLEGDFDVVFTSFGALNWLPDLPRWAEVVAHFVRPGGFFYIAEAHPFAWTFDDDDTPTGLPLDSLPEPPGVPWKMSPFMVETEPSSGVWRLPEPDDARLPLLYSLKA